MRKALLAVITAVAALLVGAAVPAVATVHHTGVLRSMHMSARPTDCQPPGEYEPFWFPTANPPYVDEEWLCNFTSPAWELQTRAYCHPTGGTNYFVYGNMVSVNGDFSTATCNSGDELEGGADRFNKEDGNGWGGWQNYYQN